MLKRLIAISFLAFPILAMAQSLGGGGIATQRSLRLFTHSFAACETARANAAAPRAEFTKDAKGRPSMVRVKGVDYVFEYGTDLDKNPVALVGNGRRVLFQKASPAAVRAAMQPLKKRSQEFRQFLEYCGISKASASLKAGGGSPGAETQGLVTPEEPDEDVPEDWFNPDFWGDYWEPTFEDYSMDAVLKINEKDWTEWQRQCMASCNSACDVATDVAAGGCAIAAVLSGPFGPEVGAACAIGTIVGKYTCKNGCNGKCGT